jgi:signal transduction histidine kinase
MHALTKEIPQPINAGKGKEIFLHDVNHTDPVMNNFISSLSHSMHDPLKAIRRLVKLLTDGTNHAHVDPGLALKHIEESTYRIEAMLDELDEFVMSSSSDTESRSIDVDDLILQEVMGLQKEIKQQKIDISVQAEQSGPFYSDPARLRMILDHLLKNAITFQRTGNPNKKINVRASVDDVGCTLSVEDNGVGIEPDDVNNIFTMFCKTARTGHRAGIGLFVVREALQKLGGKLSLDSRPGEGSLFKFFLPNVGLKVSIR